MRSEMLKTRKNAKQISSGKFPENFPNLENLEDFRVSGFPGIFLKIFRFPGRRKFGKKGNPS